MQTQIIKILEDRLSLELSTYNNLPFHLAWLYITLKKTNTIFFNSMYIKYHKTDFHPDPSNPEDDYTTYSYDNLKFSSGQILNGYGIFSTPCYVVNTNWVWKKTKAIKNNNNYIYYRHDRLKNLINTICNQYSLENKQIPFKYVVPYLFFNRDKKITMVNITGTKILKYDLQNESIKEKDQYHLTSKYFKLIENYKVIDWYNASLNFLYCVCYLK